MTKCLVKGCTNRRDQGSFVGDLCEPCYHILTTGQHNFSKAWFIKEIEKLLKENTRLFDLFKIQSDQTAAHIKGLNESLDAKREVYMKEIERLRKENTKLWYWYNDEMIDPGTNKEIKSSDMDADAILADARMRRIEIQDAEIERLRELRDTMLKGEVAIRQRDADEIEQLRDQLVIAKTTQENLHEEINRLRSELDACGKCVKVADEEIDRLRGHKIVDEAVSMQVVIELRKEVEELKCRIKDYEREEEEVTKWKNEGEALVESAKNWPLFKFANWWSDRPWRK